MSGHGKFSAMVWPTYVGVLNHIGGEPWSDPDYRRSPIVWETVAGLIMGHIREKLLVPAGTYTHFAFCYHPSNMNIAALLTLDHPFHFTAPGEIDLTGITEEDFTTKAVVPLTPKT